MTGNGTTRRGLIRQGDLLLVPVEGLDPDARRFRSGRLVLAEGEATGHAHVVDDEHASLHGDPWSEARFLSVEGGSPVLLVHESATYGLRRERRTQIAALAGIGACVRSFGHGP